MTLEYTYLGLTNIYDLLVCTNVSYETLCIYANSKCYSNMLMNFNLTMPGILMLVQLQTVFLFNSKSLLKPSS